jgi:hypothetical protein
MTKCQLRRRGPVDQLNWSDLKPEEKFERMWLEHGVGGREDYERNFVFLKTGSKMQLDFAWPRCRLGVEIHGFGHGHQSIGLKQGIIRDCVKIREAIACGWMILPYTSYCVSAKERCEEAAHFVCDMVVKRMAEFEPDLFRKR